MSSLRRDFFLFLLLSFQCSCRPFFFLRFIDRSVCLVVVVVVVVTAAAVSDFSSTEALSFYQLIGKESSCSFVRGSMEETKAAQPGSSAVRSNIYNGEWQKIRMNEILRDG